jgi:hypothetical protein
MSANQLLGRQVRVRADDLFAAAAPAVIRTIDSDSSSMILEFVPPVRVGEVAYAFAVARARLERDDLETLLRKGLLGCGVTCVPADHYDPAKPFDLSWWRGGGAAIADVVL